MPRKLRHCRTIVYFRDNMAERGGYNITDQYGTYFVTFTTVGWVDIFSRKQCRDIIIDSLRYCTQHKGLQLHAYVIMSNHVHMIATADPDSPGLSGVLRDMKRYTSNQIIKWITTSGKESRREWMEVVLKYHAKFNKRNSKYQVWQQDNNHPVQCTHPKFTIQKLNYIHSNPVVAGIVDQADHYKYSSAKDYHSQKGILDITIIDHGVQEGYVML